jgi:hydrogenase-4 membrane subunit HyfE
MMRPVVRMLAVAWTVLCFAFFLISWLRTGEQQAAIAVLCLVSLLITWGLFATALGHQSATTHGSAA